MKELIFFSSTFIIIPRNNVINNNNNNNIANKTWNIQEIKYEGVYTYYYLCKYLK